jgi:hypothetical protein
VKAFVKSYRWKGPVFAIAAISGDGCRALTFAIQNWLDAHPAYTVPSATDVDPNTIAVTPSAASDLRPAAPVLDAGTPVLLTPAPIAPRRRRAARKTDG